MVNKTVVEKTDRFWELKTLQQFSSDEWESLCDGCGRCCVHKFEDDETGRVYVTNLACHLLDLETCRCRDYTHRKQQVPDCTVLTINRIEEFQWLPSTCAYRLVAEGKPLPEWHPLVSNNPASVRDAGIAICGRVISEDDAEDPHHHITDWTF